MNHEAQPPGRPSNTPWGVRVKNNLHGLPSRDLLLFVLEPTVEEPEEIGRVRAIKSHAPLLKPDAIKVGAVCNHELHPRRRFQLLDARWHNAVIVFCARKEIVEAVPHLEGDAALRLVRDLHLEKRHAVFSVEEIPEIRSLVGVAVDADIRGRARGQSARRLRSNARHFRHQDVSCSGKLGGSRALELDVASGASLFASRTGADKNWNLGLISDMKDRGTNHETLLLIRARPTWQKQ